MNCKDCNSIITWKPSEMSAAAIESGAMFEELGVELCPRHAEAEARIAQLEADKEQLDAHARCNACLGDNPTCPSCGGSGLAHHAQAKLETELEEAERLLNRVSGFTPSSDDFSAVQDWLERRKVKP